MTRRIRQLAMFASKNNWVVQIRIRVSHVEAVLERWSLPANERQRYFVTTSLIGWVQT